MLKKLCVGDNYCANLLDWFNEVVQKNIAIKKSIDKGMNQEKFKKYRQHVYWINFGRGVGSEFQDYHYALVLFEAEHLADGDIEIFPMKKEHFTTFFEAYEAREEHLSLCENISIYLYEIN